MRIASTLGAPTLVAVTMVVVAACVGDDPVLGAGVGTDGAGPDTSVAADAPANDASTNADAAESGIDAGPRCDPSKAFANPTKVEGTVNSMSSELGASLLPGEKEIVFGRDVGAASTLRVSRRTALGALFGNEQALVAGSYAFLWPTLTTDGKDMLVSRYISSTEREIWALRRSSAGNMFPTPPSTTENVVAGLAHLAGDLDETPYLLPDASALYFARGGKLARAARMLPDSNGHLNYGAPTLVSNIFADGNTDVAPVVTPDELTIYFARAAGVGKSPTDATVDFQIYVNTRANVVDDFSTAASEALPINSAQSDIPLWLSPDGCALYFSSSRAGGPGSFDLWYVTRDK